jgi:hypothetical protein
MLVTLVALLCNSRFCLERVITTSDLSGITMIECQLHAQMGITVASGKPLPGLEAAKL